MKSSFIKSLFKVVLFITINITFFQAQIESLLLEDFNSLEKKFENSLNKKEKDSLLNEILNYGRDTSNHELYLKSQVYSLLNEEDEFNKSKLLNSVIKEIDVVQLHQIKIWSLFKISKFYLKELEYANGIIKLETYYNSDSSLFSSKDKSNYYNILGVFYGRLGQDNYALNCFEKALVYSETSGDSKELVMTLSNLGVAYLNKEDSLHDYVYNLLRRAEALYENSSEIYFPNIYSTMALYYKMNSDYDSTIIYFNKAINNSKVLDFENKADGYLNLTSMYYKASQIEKALSTVNIAIENYTNYNKESLGYLRSILIKSKILGETNKLEAYKLIQENLSYSDNEVLYPTRKFLLFDQIQYASSLGYTREQIYLQEEYINCLNILHDNELKQILNQVEESDVVLKYKQNQALLKKDNLLLEEQLKGKNYLFVLVSALLIISFFAYYFFLKSQRKEKELIQVKLKKNEDLLNTKNKELLSISFELKKQIEAFEELKDGLNSQLNGEYKSDYYELNKLLQRTDKKVSEENADYFKEMILLSDTDFHNKLREDFDNLTEDEVRLSGLIRLNVDNDQLVKIFNISKESLHKKRYRLRKKFNLQKGHSLEKFIYSL